MFLSFSLSLSVALALFPSISFSLPAPLFSPLHPSYFPGSLSIFLCSTFLLFSLSPAVSSSFFSLSLSVRRTLCSFSATCPLQDDDVVTSPYNSVLAMHQLQEHADAVFPVENQALQDIVQRIDTQSQGTRPQESQITIEQTTI